MQKFILALFSVVALLGLVVPSSFAYAERNSDRLARGLPPLPPSRRGTARHGTPSHVHKHHDHPLPPTRRDTARHGTPSHVHKHHDHPLPPSRRGTARRGTPSQVHKLHGQNSDRIQIRDTDGKLLGYLTDFTGGDRDLSVVYHAGSHSLSYHGQGSDAHFLGAAVSNANLGPGSPAYVTLTNVALNDNQANAHIWTLEDGQLTAAWPNHGGTTAVNLCLNAAGNDIILTGDSCPSGWEGVQFYLSK